MNKMYLKFVMALFILVVAESKIPDYIKVCRRSDSNLNDCIKKSVYAVVPSLRNGIPELNVPPIEPFHVKNIGFHSDSGGVKLYATLKDILAYNGSKFEILDLQTDVPNCWAEFHIRLPNFYLNGNYEINAKILALPIDGKGDFKLNITELRFTCTLKGKLNDKDGVPFVKYDKLRLNITVGTFKINLENLFNANPTLGKATNDVINNNPDIFYEVIKPIMEDALAELFSDITNKITETFNYNELFPQ